MNGVPDPLPNPTEDRTASSRIRKQGSGAQQTEGVGWPASEHFNGDRNHDLGSTDDHSDRRSSKIQPSRAEALRLDPAGFGTKDLTLA